MRDTTGKGCGCFGRELARFSEACAHRQLDLGAGCSGSRRQWSAALLGLEALEAGSPSHDTTYRVVPRWLKRPGGASVRPCVGPSQAWELVWKNQAVPTTVRGRKRPVCVPAPARRRPVGPPPNPFSLWPLTEPAAAAQGELAKNMYSQTASSRCFHCSKNVF